MGIIRSSMGLAAGAKWLKNQPREREYYTEIEALTSSKGQGTSQPSWGCEFVFSSGLVNAPNVNKTTHHPSSSSTLHAKVNGGSDPHLSLPMWIRDTCFQYSNPLWQLPSSIHSHSQKLILTDPELIDEQLICPECQEGLIALVNGFSALPVEGFHGFLFLNSRF